MKKISTLLIAVFLLVGCSTRSISNSGYSRHGYHGSGSNSIYRGELSDFDVLGVSAGAEVTDETIRQAFVEAPNRKLLRKGDPILLIQSGALIPDEEMIAQLEETFAVSVFTGVPEKEKPENKSYANSLRLAAAKSGIGTVVVYWGVLESGTVNLVTKTVSWLPLVGRGVPDEAQRMRIRLKVAVIDVRSGQWEIFAPGTVDDKAISTRLNRKSSDQSQVATLKTEAYALAAKALTTRFLK